MNRFLYSVVSCGSLFSDSAYKTERIIYFNMSEEIWKDIFHWYKVSSLWRIKSKKWKLLKINLNRHWYDRVSIKWKFYWAHRLVWYAFLWLDISNKKMLVCHKNDIRCDNRVENLFLWSHKDNSIDAVRKWRIPNIYSNKKVYQYSLSWELIKEWESCKDIRESWITSHASSCALWKRKTAWWFIWKY